MVVGGSVPGGIDILPRLTKRTSVLFHEWRAVVGRDEPIARSPEWFCAHWAICARSLSSCSTASDLLLWLTVASRNVTVRTSLARFLSARYASPAALCVCDFVAGPIVALTAVRAPAAVAAMNVISASSDGLRALRPDDASGCWISTRPPGRDRQSPAGHGSLRCRVDALPRAPWGRAERSHDPSRQEGWTHGPDTA